MNDSSGDSNPGHAPQSTNAFEVEQGKVARRSIVLESIGILAIATVATVSLASSWRRWAHPTIDSGRELHIPWRLSEGAVLYRDVDNVYGPLSQYFNAGLFRLFGPGMMVLVYANLVIFCAIVTGAYIAFRRAWGATGALAACLIFCSVFAFSQLIGPQVFNYALPYAHEVTHGTLVSLILLICLAQRLETGRIGWTVSSGFCAGLTLVLKPEFMLAAAALTVTASFLHRRLIGVWPACDALPYIGSALVPPTAFAIYFGLHFDPAEALLAANRAWTSLWVFPEMLSSQHQIAFSGMDRPWENLRSHALVTLLAAALLVGLWKLLALALRVAQRAGRVAAISGVTVLAGAVGTRLEWSLAGRCLLPLSLAVLYLSWRRLGREEPKGPTLWRIMLGTLAAAMMARMALNGRIVQFGFYQAALAAMVLAAFLSSGAAEAFRGRHSIRVAVAVVASALLAPAGFWAAAQSRFYQRLETHRVAEGRDAFWFFTPEIEPSGELLNLVVAELRKLPPETRVLTLPEGSMVNYLARRKSPLRYFQYHSFTTEGGREADIVSALSTNPPEIVVILSRGLDDFGVKRYGESDGAGKRIIEWVDGNYEITHHFGGDPLDLANQRGAYILRLRERARKPAASTPQ